MIYRQFPLLTIHDKAMIASEATEAAGAQSVDAFWKMHDLIFQRQQDWSAKTADEMPAVLSGYAKELGLDTKTFDEALAKHTYKDKVQASYDAAVKLGLRGTPSLMANGVQYPGDQWGFSSEGFDIFIKLLLLKPLQLKEPPPTVIQKDKQYQATIQTEKGDIVLELYADKTPLTVNSFVYLSQQGWFSNTTFHRVVPGFVAQAGDPTGSGIAWPGYRCSDELSPDLTFDGPGVLGMANSGANSDGSQFFITMAPQPTLNGKHTVFGRVTQGMDVVQKLTARDPQTAPAGQLGDRIIAVKIEEK